MDDKIENAIAYYTKQGDAILAKVNSSNNLTADEIIHYGEEMSKIEYKLTALEVARES
ncbi:hypothetical protein HSX10_08335 [Winogradskyella undariae]|uniref:hypothetical protein n=1 Tax=Winogradskyella TaxID=286104 RepID=UPI00156B0868|nr:MULTISPECIES: hypothetical protein [Winogradskyella]NRR91569.1 hypothetical protein [Winogradskyella undariae]QXP80684.1 hypothetical protein H0I32_08755 [Winogradskyella sp. HaHa_3_26]